MHDMHLFARRRSSISIGKIDRVRGQLSVSKDARWRLSIPAERLSRIVSEPKTPRLWDSPGARKLRAQPTFEIRGAQSRILGACVPLSPFVPRPFVGSFVGFVRSLRSRSAPVVEVDAKVGVLSREKGVSRAPVSPPSSPGPPSDPEFPPRAHALPAARGWRSRVVRSRPASFASEHVWLRARFEEQSQKYQYCNSPNSTKFVLEEERNKEREAHRMFPCRSPPGTSQWLRVHGDYRLPSVFKRLRVESLITPISEKRPRCLLPSTVHLTVTVDESLASRSINRDFVIAGNSSRRVFPPGARGNSAGYPWHYDGTREVVPVVRGWPRGMSSWHVTPWPWLAQLQRPPRRGSSSGARINESRQHEPVLQSAGDRVPPAAAGAGQARLCDPICALLASAGRDSPYPD